MSQPTAAQIETWESYKLVAQRTDIEIRITQLQAENCALAVQFAHRKGLAQNVDISGLLAELETVTKKGEKLKNAIGGVELQEIGIRFRNGDIDLMAFPGSNSDLVANYQLGWVLVAAGIVLAVGIIGYMAALRHQNHELGGKLSGVTDDMNALLCGDPTSALCAEWEQIKEGNRYEERENLIDQSNDVAEALPDVVKKAASWGLSIGIPIALLGMVILWRD